MAISKAIVSVLVVALLASALGVAIMLTQGGTNQGAGNSGKTFEGLSVTETGATQTISSGNDTIVQVDLSITNSKSTSVDPKSITYTATLSNGKRIVGTYLGPTGSIAPGKNEAISIHFKIDPESWSDKITSIQCSDSTGYLDLQVDIALTIKEQEEVNWYGTPTLDGFYEHEPVWPSITSHQSMGTWGMGATSSSATRNLQNGSYYLFNLSADTLISMNNWSAVHNWSSSAGSWFWDLDFNHTDSWMMSVSSSNVEVWAGNGGPAHSNQMFQRTAEDGVFSLESIPDYYTLMVTNSATQLSTKIPGAIVFHETGTFTLQFWIEDKVNGERVSPLINETVTVSIGESG